MFVCLLGVVGSVSNILPPYCNYYQFLKLTLDYFLHARPCTSCIYINSFHHLENPVKQVLWYLLFTFYRRENLIKGRLSYFPKVAQLVTVSLKQDCKRFGTNDYGFNPHTVKRLKRDTLCPQSCHSRAANLHTR